MLKKHVQRNRGRLAELAAERERCAREIKKMQEDDRAQRLERLRQKIASGEMPISHMLSEPELDILLDLDDGMTMGGVLTKHGSGPVAINFLRGLQSGDDQERFAWSKEAAAIIAKREALLEAKNADLQIVGEDEDDTGDRRLPATSAWLRGLLAAGETSAS